MSYLTLRVHIMEKFSTIYRFSKNKSIDMMQTKVNVALNPLRYHLSREGQKRLGWMYVIHREGGGNVSRAARKIGVSRTWLSLIHSRWERAGRDPRSLEPESRAPHHTENRRRVSKETENKIIELRKKYRPWGKDKLAVMLKRDWQRDASASTVNRYLHKHGLIDPKLSEKNKRAWARKKEQVELRLKIRPPAVIKDYQPGALIEKDMKFILKMGAFTNLEKFKAKENFWYQHTIIDSFTRIRGLGLARDADSKTAAAVQVEVEKRLPFAISCLNTDSGGENGGDFSERLDKKKIVHFFSRAGAPTDNPRVERSHLTDEVEFYRQGNSGRNFSEQSRALATWEHTYNCIRPHQALGYLTPMEFYALWKQNPKEAYSIKDKYQSYLKRQNRQLAQSRRMKKKEQIENLMRFIDQKLSKN